MDIKAIIKPFIDLTRETFDSMMDITLDLKDIQAANPRHRQAGVYSLIGISGDMQGTVAISMPEATALKALSQFLGEDILALDEAACDAAGELINIIAGAKSKVVGYQLTMSLPSVIVGDPLLISLPRDVPLFEVTFDATGIGEFNLLICLAKSN